MRKPGGAGAISTATNVLEREGVAIELLDGSVNIAGGAKEHVDL